MWRCGHRDCVWGTALFVLLGVGSGSAAAQDAHPSQVPAGAMVAVGAVDRARSSVDSTKGGERVERVTVEETARRRHRSGGDESLDECLRRRAVHEERRRAELIDEANMSLLRQFYRECAIGADMLSSCVGAMPSPSLMFLRSVAPPDEALVIFERRGFDGWASRQVEREWRRRYGADLGLRVASENHPRPDLLDSEQIEVERSFDRVRAAEWSTRFPLYWTGHEQWRQRERIVLGEDLEVVRLFGVSFNNDLSIRYDVRSVVAPYLPAVQPTQGLTQTLPYHAENHDRIPVGNVYTGSFCTLDARVRLGGGLNAFQTGFVRRVGGEVDWLVFRPYDQKRLFLVELDLEYDTTKTESTASLMFALLNF